MNNQDKNRSRGRGRPQVLIRLIQMVSVLYPSNVKTVRQKKTTTAVFEFEFTYSTIFLTIRIQLICYNIVFTVVFFVFNNYFREFRL